MANFSLEGNDDEVLHLPGGQLITRGELRKLRGITEASGGNVSFQGPGANTWEHIVRDDAQMPRSDPDAQRLADSDAAFDAKFKALGLDMNEPEQFNARMAQMAAKLRRAATARIQPRQQTALQAPRMLEDSDFDPPAEQPFMAPKMLEDGDLAPENATQQKLKKASARRVK